MDLGSASIAQIGQWLMELCPQREVCVETGMMFWENSSLGTFCVSVCLGSRD